MRVATKGLKIYYKQTNTYIKLKEYQTLLVLILEVGAGAGLGSTGNTKG